MNENEISKIIIDRSYYVYGCLGPGLFESVYEEVLNYELQKKGLDVKRQVNMPVTHDNIKMDVGFCLDLLVDDKVIIELKSVETIKPVHKKQLLTYLKLADLRLGVLINFNVETLNEGIKRVVNKL